MMIDPVDRYKEETEQICEQGRPEREKIAESVAERLFQFQYHDSDDDRQYADTQGKYQYEVIPHEALKGRHLFFGFCFFCIIYEKAVF